MTLIEELRIAVPHGDRALALAADYRAAQPWPHLVLNDVVPRELALAAYDEEIQRLDEMPRSEGARSRKWSAPTGFLPAARHILDELESPAMMDFYRLLSGCDDLEADPTHTWAGVHVNGPGDHHVLHRDFMRHPGTWRWHRLNVMLYLNPQWEHEWGGQLELWGRGARMAGAIVQPVAPTLVIFETTPAAIHGLPEPVHAPDGHLRLSLATYFYSKSTPHRPYHPLFARPRRPQDPWRRGIATRGEVLEGLEMRAKDRSRALYHRLQGLLGR